MSSSFYSSLTKWGLPQGIVEGYKTHFGIESLHSIQDLALNSYFSNIISLYDSVYYNVEGENKESLLVSLPTSGGKSLISEIIAFRTLLGTRINRETGEFLPYSEGSDYSLSSLSCPPQRVLFLSPFKALVEEKYQLFVKLFCSADPSDFKYMISFLQNSYQDLSRRTQTEDDPRLRRSQSYSEYSSILKSLDAYKHVPQIQKLVGTSVGGFTAEYGICIATYERGTRAVSQLFEEGRENELGVVVIDEAHFIGDPRRGAQLEALLCKIFYHNSRIMRSSVGTGASMRILPIRVILLSATISNVNILGRWCRASVISSLQRPIPIRHRIAFMGRLYDVPSAAQPQHTHQNQWVCELCKRIEIVNDGMPFSFSHPLDFLLSEAMPSRCAPGTGLNSNPRCSAPMMMETGKYSTVLDLIAESIFRGHQCLVFCSTKQVAAELVKLLDTELASNPALAEAVMSKFNPGLDPTYFEQLRSSFSLPSMSSGSNSSRSAQSLVLIRDSADPSSASVGGDKKKVLPFGLRSTAPVSIPSYENLSLHRQQHLLRCGIGQHTGDQSDVERGLVEQLSRDKRLHTIFSTTTLSAGVSLPVSRCIIVDPKHFNDSGPVPLPPALYRQMAGRSGRLTMENLGLINDGECITVTDSISLHTLYHTLHSDEDPILSQLVTVPPPIADSVPVKMKGELPIIREHNFDEPTQLLLSLQPPVVRRCKDDRRVIQPVAERLVFEAISSGLCSTLEDLLNLLSCSLVFEELHEDWQAVFNIVLIITDTLVGRGFLQLAAPSDGDKEKSLSSSLSLKDSLSTILSHEPSISGGNDDRKMDVLPTSPSLRLRKGPFRASITLESAENIRTIELTPSEIKPPAMEKEMKSVPKALGSSPQLRATLALVPHLSATTSMSNGSIGSGRRDSLTSISLEEQLLTTRIELTPLGRAVAVGAVPIESADVLLRQLDAAVAQGLPQSRGDAVIMALAVGGVSPPSLKLRRSVMLGSTQFMYFSAEDPDSASDSKKRVDALCISPGRKRKRASSSDSKTPASPESSTRATLDVDMPVVNPVTSTESVRFPRMPPVEVADSESGRWFLDVLTHIPPMARAAVHAMEPVEFQEHRNRVLQALGALKLGDGEREKNLILRPWDHPMAIPASTPSHIESAVSFKPVGSSAKLLGKLLPTPLCQRWFPSLLLASIAYLASSGLVNQPTSPSTPSTTSKSIDPYVLDAVTRTATAANVSSADLRALAEWAVRRLGVLASLALELGLPLAALRAAVARGHLREALAVPRQGDESASLSTTLVGGSAKLKHVLRRLPDLRASDLRAIRAAGCGGVRDLALLHPPTLAHHMSVLPFDRFSFGRVAANSSANTANMKSNTSNPAQNGCNCGVFVEIAGPASTIQTGPRTQLFSVNSLETSLGPIYTQQCPLHPLALELTPQAMKSVERHNELFRRAYLVQLEAVRVMERRQRMGPKIVGTSFNAAVQREIQSTRAQERLDRADKRLKETGMLPTPHVIKRDPESFPQPVAEKIELEGQTDEEGDDIFEHAFQDQLLYEQEIIQNEVARRRIEAQNPIHSMKKGPVDSDEPKNDDRALMWAIDELEEVENNNLFNLVHDVDVSFLHVPQID